MDESSLSIERVKQKRQAFLNTMGMKGLKKIWFKGQRRLKKQLE